MAPIQGSVAQSGERHSVTVEEAGSKPVGTATYAPAALGRAGRLISGLGR